MIETNKNKVIPFLMTLVFVFSACGTTPPQQAQGEIATSVALTVQAQNSLTKVASLPTATPVPPIQTTPTPEPVFTNTPTEASNPGCVAAADLISESPPDGIMYTPGTYFWKTWTFRNTGSCYWDKSYSLVFVSGDLMGGLISYPIPDEVAPQDTIDISIYLLAPATDGKAQGYWQLRTPWNVNFGVGPTNSPFYVQVNVSSNPDYGIANVTFELLRDPDTGCPLNVWYTVRATVTSNGPVTFSYMWEQSDGNESGEKSYKFKEAGSITLEREWMVSLRDNPTIRWIKFIVTEPDRQGYNEIIIDHRDCINNSQQ